MLNLNNVKLQITAVKKAQYPSDGKQEVAFVGRSNVGKSSLINYLMNRKALARVSSTPGKTRVINFYNIDEKLYFVDLPGYGYAKVSQKEREAWAEMINEYILEREQLKLFALLVDIRHQPSELDIMMTEWIRQSKINFAVIATKADKINLSEREKNIQNIRETLGITKDGIVIPVSAFKKFGRDEIWKLIEQKVIK